MSEYIPAKKNWAHQDKAQALMGDRESFALFCGMRTGKSKITLDNWGRLEFEQKCQDLMIIAPGGVYKTWLKALWGDPDVPGDVGHLSEDLRSRVLVHTWKSGANQTQRRALDAFMQPTEHPRALLMNVEALSSVREAREVSIAFSKPRKTMGAIDETTSIKNPSSKRTKFINQKLACEFDYRRILSGLPNPRSPLDYYSEFEFLDWKLLGFRSYYSFRARYAKMAPIQVGGRTIQVVKGYQNLEDLTRRLEPHCYRVALRDCYDVPEKMYLFREVEMTPEQTRIYGEMKRYATAKLDGEAHVTATVVIAQITRLSQILCGHVPDEEGKLHEIPENRTQAILDILEDYEGKAIIWCAYSMDIVKVSSRVAEEYGEAAVARFWGGNQSTREDEERRFLHDPECRYLFATAAAGGRGRTWTVADLIIYHSNTEDLEHRDQSEERGSGIGKDDRVTVIDLCVRGTVDDKKIKALRAKIDLATAVNGEGYRAWLI